MKLLYFLFVAVFLIRNVKLTSNFLEGYNFDHVPAKLIQTYFENWNKWKSYYNKIYDNHLEESKEFYNWVLNTVKVIQFFCMSEFPEQADQSLDHIEKPNIEREWKQIIFVDK